MHARKLSRAFTSRLRSIVPLRCRSQHVSVSFERTPLLRGHRPDDSFQAETPHSKQKKKYVSVDGNNL
jgi:hypothetical protein